MVGNKKRASTKSKSNYVFTVTVVGGPQSGKKLLKQKLAEVSPKLYQILQMIDQEATDADLEADVLRLTIPLNAQKSQIWDVVSLKVFGRLNLCRT